MTSNKTNDAVVEYLHELELRLSGLPVLQRRELLAEIEAHINNERVERAAASESDILELLERLGSPEVVAAAAYEEAGIGDTSRQQVLAYAGTTRAAVRPLPPIPPPPDSPPPAYAGPFPPKVDFGQSYAGHRPFDAPPPAAGPPFAPPPAPRQESETGIRVLVGVAIAAVVVVLLGCLAGSFFLAQGATVDEAPATAVVEPERPGPVPPQVDPVDPAQPAPPRPTVG